MWENDRLLNTWEGRHVSSANGAPVSNSSGSVAMAIVVSAVLLIAAGAAAALISIVSVRVQETTIAPAATSVPASSTIPPSTSTTHVPSSTTRAEITSTGSATSTSDAPSSTSTSTVTSAQTDTETPMLTSTSISSTSAAPSTLEPINIQSIDPLCDNTLRPCSHLEWAVHWNGLCWAWASPCAGGSSCAFSTAVVPSEYTQWELASPDQIWTLRPSVSEFWEIAHGGSQTTMPECPPSFLGSDRFFGQDGCASDKFNSFGFDHCDFCDNITRFADDGSTNDTWVACGGSVVLQALSDPFNFSVPCHAPTPVISNGNVSCSDAFNVTRGIEMINCTVSCDANYYPEFPDNDTQLFACYANEWRNVPQCRFSGCEVGPDIFGSQNSITACAGTLAGQTCSTWTCPIGLNKFPFSGNPICLGDGLWGSQFGTTPHVCMSPAEISCFGNRHTCSTCISSTGCGWCESARRCIPGSSGGPQTVPYCPDFDFFYDRCYTVRAPSLLVSEPDVTNNIRVIDPNLLGGLELSVINRHISEGCFTRCLSTAKACAWNNLDPDCDFAPLTNTTCLGQFETRDGTVDPVCLCNEHQADDGSKTCSLKSCEFVPVNGCKNGQPCVDDPPEKVDVIFPFPTVETRNLTRCECSSEFHGQDCGIHDNETSSFGPFF